jgi:hypothetical protein
MSEEDPKKPTDSSAPSLAGQAKEAASIFQQSLRKSIHETVVATNGFLGSLEKTTGEISQPLVQGLKVVEHEASYLASKGLHVYERRHEFGPHLVVGSALTVGGLVALRRGRFSGAISGALTAGLTYVTLYELTPLDDISDLFRERD